MCIKELDNTRKKKMGVKGTRHCVKIVLPYVNLQNTSSKEKGLFQNSLLKNGLHKGEND